MSVSLGLFSHRERNLELHVGTDAAALQVARLALPVVEVSNDAGVQRVPCPNHHVLFVKSVVRAGRNVLFFALLADESANATAVEQAVERLAEQHARLPNVDPVAVKRLLQTAVDQANNRTDMVGRTQIAADDLTSHLRDETVPLLLDRHDRIDELVERTRSISSSTSRIGSRKPPAAKADVVPPVPEPRSRRALVVWLSVALLIVALVSYLIASSLCGGFRLERC
jgi:hypothetical protein